MADQKAYGANKITDPADNLELILGTSTTKIVNITLANFYTKLMSKLGFLKTNNHLNEYSGNTSAQTAVQTNINVPSKSNVLEKNNTTAYTPTQQYHPTTKGYVDDKYRFGTFQYHTPWSTGSRVVPISPAVASNNYHVDLTITTVNGGRGMYPLNVTNKTLNSFTINVDPENDNIMLEPHIDWKITMR